MLLGGISPTCYTKLAITGGDLLRWNSAASGNHVSPVWNQTLSSKITMLAFTERGSSEF